MGLLLTASINLVTDTGINLSLRGPTEILLNVSFAQQRGDCERGLNGLIIDKNKRSEIRVLAPLDL